MMNLSGVLDLTNFAVFLLWLYVVGYSHGANGVWGVSLDTTMALRRLVVVILLVALSARVAVGLGWLQ